MAATWLRAAAALPGLQIAGLVDLDPAAALRQSQEFAPDAATGTDLDALLDRLHPDLVFNCTVPGAHHAVTTAALRHGCHVLTEKPLAGSLAEARDLVAASAEADRLLAVIQNRRYTPAIRQVRALIASGALGTLTEVATDFYLGAHFGGFRATMPHVLLVDMAIHHFDMARFITGADPVSVFCHEWNPAGSWYRHGANAHALFELTGGIIFNYRGSWCAEGLNTTWGGAWRIVGTQGTLRWNGNEHAGGDSLVLDTVVKTGEFRSDLKRSSWPSPPVPTRDDGHASLIAEFADCVRHRRLPETHAADNLHSLAMVFGAIASAESNQRVAISP
jgi:predicted dehydrogenase